MRVSGDLRTASNALRSIAHEVVCRMLPTASNVVGHAQLRVRIDCRPRPNVAPALRLLLGSDILFLRADELPDFVALQATDSHPSHGAVVIVPANLSQVYKETRYRVLRNTSHADGRANRASLNQAPNNLRATGAVQSVHIDHYACTGMNCQ